MGLGQTTLSRFVSSSPSFAKLGCRFECLSLEYLFFRLCRAHLATNLGVFGMMDRVYRYVQRLHGRSQGKKGHHQPLRQTGHGQTLERREHFRLMRAHSTLSSTEPRNRGFSCALARFMSQRDKLPLAATTLNCSLSGRSVSKSWCIERTQPRGGGARALSGGTYYNFPEEAHVLVGSVPTCRE